MGDTAQPYKLNNIPDQEWEQIRSRLGFYFAHHGTADPEDLAQDTLSRVIVWLQDGNRIEGKDGLAKLCYGFARNVLREQRPSRPKQTDPIDSDIPERPNKSFGLASSETAILVRQVLGRLPGPDREIILSAELMTPAAMAAVFRTSVPNINLRLCRARQRFRRGLRSALGLPGGA
ncbi:RNA polymerase sigma factor [Paludibaculum fermentans]|uniref:RNA polymerase sigma factor n=1 Tax=Paludibaculum fermentans TaxID=1473598 RepID=UPI003EBCCDF7